MTFGYREIRRKILKKNPHFLIHVQCHRRRRGGFLSSLMPQRNRLKYTFAFFRLILVAVSASTYKAERVFKSNINKAIGNRIGNKHSMVG